MKQCGFLSVACPINQLVVNSLISYTYFYLPLNLHYGAKGTGPLKL